MGTNAAMMTKKVIDNTYQVLAIEMMTILQAVDYLGFKEKMSCVSMKIFEDLREIVPKFQDDKIKYKDVQNIEHYLHENKLHFSLKL